jgi:hypothetical protein
MRGHLVTRIVNAAHERGVLLRDPAQREECSARAMLLQEREHSIHRLLYPARVAVPLLARHHAFEGSDLEVLFHVDCKDVFHRSARGRHRDLRHAGPSRNSISMVVHAVLQL